MYRLVNLLVTAALLFSLVSCGKGEKKGTLPGTGRQTSLSAEAKRAFDRLEAELVENAGLVFEDMRVDADSIFATIRLTDSALTVWRDTEKALGRAPSLAWATVSARFYRGGELSATHSLRFGQVRNLSPDRPLITVSLARNPMRSGGQSPRGLSLEGDVQCAVLGVRIQ